MSNRVRILHVVQNLHFGGMERIIAELARRSDAARFDTHVMALQYLGHFADGLDAFATLHLAAPMSRWSMLYPSNLAGQIRAIAPDVLHTHSGVWYKAGLAAQIARVPFAIHTDHGRQNPDPWIYRRVDNIASHRTDVVVAVSEALADQMRRIVYDPHRVRVIANGVDTVRYAPCPYDGSLHHELGLDPNTPLLGSVGRLETIKGFDVMIAAFVRFLQRYRGPVRPRLILIGDGSQRAALEQSLTTEDAEVRNAVSFLGWRSDIERCLSAFSLFTMSSHSEGTSVGLLEAMSSGLCPVVTNVGGNAAVLGQPLEHRLVAPANPDALATAWIDALSDPERLAHDAQQSRQRVLDGFGLDAMVRQYEQIYELLYAQRHKRPYKRRRRVETAHA